LQQSSGQRVLGVLEVSVDKESVREKKISYSFGTSRRSMKPIWIDKVHTDAKKLKT
jgi:hypothetical protein